MSKKIISLTNLINEIKIQKYITIEQFETLKYYSVQPGGFSLKNKKSNENQKIIYRALLNMQKKEDINFLKNIKNHPSKIISKNFNDELENKNHCEEIIAVNKDIDRNIFYKWKEKNKDIDYDLNEFEKEIENYLRKNKNKYSYYQGYLDFCVYFYIIFKDKKEKNIEYIDIIQFFTELYLKDYISPYKSIGTVEDIVFQNTLNLLIGIIKILDFELFQIFDKDKTPLCLILSWIISLFSHSVNNFYVARRIFDYLLINDPICAYLLTAKIIVKSLRKNIKKISEVELEEIFITIKQINLDELNFDELIKECDDFYRNNLNRVFEAQDKNKKEMNLLGDYNYRGIENFIYRYNDEEIEDRLIEKKSFIVSYKFVFMLFVTWIFVIYFFHKDMIIEKLNNGNDNNVLENQFTEDDDEI